MHKVSKILILAMALALVFGLTVSAQAKLISVETAQGTTSPNDVTLDPSGASAQETVRTFDPWTKTITIDKFKTDDEGSSKGNNVTTWHVTNDTDFAWTDYHWSIVQPEEGTVTFGTSNPPPSSDNFKTVDILNNSTELFFKDGLIPTEANKDGVNFKFDFEISGLTPDTNYEDFSFNIIQFPTNTEPPPGAPIPGSVLLLGSGLLGLIGLRWKL